MTLKRNKAVWVNLQIIQLLDFSPLFCEFCDTLLPPSMEGKFLGIVLITLNDGLMSIIRLFCWADASVKTSLDWQEGS